MSTPTITQLAPVLAAARVNTIHEPTWLYVLNFWDSRSDAQRDVLLPDTDHEAALESLRFYAEHNPDGHVPALWTRIPAVQLNPVPAAPNRLRMRAGQDVVEIDVVAAFELAQSLPFILSALAAPELEIDRAAQTTTCPHCGATFAFEADAVREVDIDIRWNRGSLRLADSDDANRDDVLDVADGELVLDVSEADRESSTIAHICDHCHKPVSLPADIESLWS